MACIRTALKFVNPQNARQIHISHAHLQAKKKYQLVVVGGGAGGCSTAAKFASHLGKGKVAIIEPADVHYYQPLWTLVGGGIKSLSQSARPMSSVLPKNAAWIKDRAVTFEPDHNRVVTENGIEVTYDFLIVAMGLQLNYHLIKGLPEALETPGVGSNYSPLHVQKTFKALKNFREGNAIFTFPNSPVKCAGAPQKIMYIAENYLNKTGRRKKANITYNTSLGVLFGVKKYADALWDVVKERDIKVNLRRNLVEVKPDAREAVFENLDDPEQRFTYKYEMLHAVPPMGAPDVLKNCKQLVDKAGFLEVNKDTLQHVRYPNVFGIGDCTNLPTAKTAAAVAGQTAVLSHNLKNVMKNKPLVGIYDGYTSCPLVTSDRTCILAEFDYQAQPLETFPFNQAKERYTMYLMKSIMMPQLYWHLLLRGHWGGPKYVRKIMHLGMSK